MSKRVTPSLVISIIALILSTTGLADAARHAIVSSIAVHRLSTKPYSKGILLLGKNKKFPVAAIPTVKNAKNATNAKTLDGLNVDALSSCPPTSVDLGTWCLMASPFPVSPQQATESNWFWASQKCVEEGGFLPTAAQLVGAAKRVKLESTIHDSRLTATVQEDPSVGLKDQREMSATLVTTTAGSDAAGSEGVSQGATGNPRTGEPNPVPVAAVPEPESAQYVTVYSNGQKGGLAGSEPVSQPENFRCGFDKTPGALNKSEE
jgi:hypothetical protein